MMNLNTAFARIAVLTILAAPIATTSALAEEAKYDETKIVALDNMAVGSVDRQIALNKCDPASANAGIICKITGGDPNATFPTAPSGPFGF